MRAVDIIRWKRDGGTLDREAIFAFVDGVTGGAWADYQASAMLMAITLRGMTEAETVTLTEAMVASGRRLVRPAAGPPRVDKHSTGGVGDKTSLVLAPMLAACGLHVPMMSGRALGHTGGTLDKLEAIPGFRVQLAEGDIARVLRQAGCCIVGQTEAIAPADRKLYAIRDVTATVESVPLIAASILSKKVAEDLDALVLDVKCGAGAFMKTLADATALATALVGIGNRSGVRTEALITDMSAPLGETVGNALEVREAIDTLAGGGPPDLRELCEVLCARLLVLAGSEQDRHAARARAAATLSSGTALERFRVMVAAQGGDAGVIDDPSRLPSVAGRHVVTAHRDGWVAAIDPMLVGRATITLGAGRTVAGEAIDPAVGAVVRAPVGARVTAGQPLLELHHRDGVRLDEAVALAVRAITIGDAPPPAAPLVIHEVS
jgi:pyrimidine-nucleoside phosphorylase